MREKRIILKDRVHVALVRRHVAHVLPEDPNGAPARLLEPGDQTKAGGLAGAGGPEHGEELALGDGEVDAIDGADIAEVPGDVLEFDGCGHGKIR